MSWDTLPASYPLPWWLQVLSSSSSLPQLPASCFLLMSAVLPLPLTYCWHIGGFLLPFKPLAAGAWSTSSAFPCSRKGGFTSFWGFWLFLTAGEQPTLGSACCSLNQKEQVQKNCLVLMSKHRGEPCATFTTVQGRKERPDQLEVSFASAVCPGLARLTVNWLMCPILVTNGPTSTWWLPLSVHQSFPLGIMARACAGCPKGLGCWEACWGQPAMVLCKTQPENWKAADSWCPAFTVRIESVPWYVWHQPWVRACWPKCSHPGGKEARNGAAEHICINKIYCNTNIIVVACASAVSDNNILSFLLWLSGPQSLPVSLNSF